MSGTESFASQQWLFETLAGDPELVGLCPGGVHEAPAPLGTTGRYITLQQVVTSDLMVVGAARVLSTQRWQVRVQAALGETTGQLAAAVARVDELLHARCHESTPWGTVISCVREQLLLAPPETIDGVALRAVIAVYRIEAQ